jgi:putative ABC transport system ATP-binding protein
MAIRTYAGLTLGALGVHVAFAERGAPPRVVLDVREFRVDGGAQVAICGPSGSGKTTLLHLFAGLERPARGVIRWGGVEVTALSERVGDLWRRETVGLVFQQFHLFPGLSALENVLLPLRFDHWSVAPDMRVRALKLLERVGVRPDVDAAFLSRGEQQRVAVARALLRKPAIVLADEPTASLDRHAANAVADLLSSMCRTVNATLIVTTHDPLLAGRLDQTFEIVDERLRSQTPSLASIPVPAPTPAVARHRLASVA